MPQLSKFTTLWCSKRTISKILWSRKGLRNKVLKLFYRLYLEEIPISTVNTSKKSITGENSKKDSIMSSIFLSRRRISMFQKENASPKKTTFQLLNLSMKIVLRSISCPSPREKKKSNLNYWNSISSNTFPRKKSLSSKNTKIKKFLRRKMTMTLELGVGLMRNPKTWKSSIEMVNATMKFWMICSIRSRIACWTRSKRKVWKRLEDWEKWMFKNDH